MSTNTFTNGSYRPRRVRSNNPPPFQLTKRDIEIVELVARNRFLNSDHIRRLVAGSAKNITNRLKALFEHGYLDRPQCQYDYYTPGGGSSFISYALGERVARLLAEKEHPGKRISWTHKNKSVRASVFWNTHWPLPIFLSACRWRWMTVSMLN